MEKKYISVSKGFIEKRMNIIFDLEHKMIEAKPYIKQLKNIINITDEEINTLENTIEILGDKIEILENLLEDKNIEFYNSYEAEGIDSF